MIERNAEIVYVDQKSLSETGRVQSVITSTKSPWAVRNVARESTRGFKTEPHIEAGVGVASENLFKFCYQGNIRSHIFSSEKYLFLLTSCRNPDFPHLKEKRVINGYIEKLGYGYQVHPERGKRYFTFGNPFVVGFPDAIPVTELGYSNFIRVKLVDEKRTAQILERFKGVKNATDEYIKEVERLDPAGNTCVLTRGEHCIFESSCLRKKPFLELPRD